jgi:poly(hydroxyalkanoate) depolymerase family esterase
MASVTSRSRDPFFCNKIMSALRPFRVLTILFVAIGAIISAHAADPREETGFGSNPGNLRMFSYVPGSIKPSAPLIVVLHGCKQKAGTFARDAGWLALADTAELAVLMPEQKGLPSFLYNFYVFPWVTAMFGANNQNACFNWFESEDTRRDSGEALSIRQMIDAMVHRYSVDPRRVYIVGLSAGGAMAVAMLVSYPELFAGGAVVAGVPYGCADSLSKALQCMNPGLDLSPDVWRARVREATGHERPVPTISIWHGTADTRVLPSNQQELVEQWTALHGIPETSVRSEQSGRITRKSYAEGAAIPQIESVLIEGYGHAFPIDGTTTCGQPGDFVVSAGVCASREIAHFWGLIGRN